VRLGQRVRSTRVEQWLRRKGTEREFENTLEEEKERLAGQYTKLYIAVVE
jgi:hypothetical protein